MAAWRSLQAVTYDAFPSMHTAISTLAVVHAYRLRLRMWIAMLPIVVLLQLATLYLRQHYFVDLVAGWAVAGIAIGGAALLERAWATAGAGTASSDPARHRTRESLGPS